MNFELVLMKQEIVLIINLHLLDQNKDDEAAAMVMVEEEVYRPQIQVLKAVASYFSVNVGEIQIILIQHKVFKYRKKVSSYIAGKQTFQDSDTQKFRKDYILTN